MRPLDLRCACVVVCGAVLSAGAAGAPPAKVEGKAKVSYPFPLITEVLYAVPTGGEGVANGDGVRHATGDEFIEIVNPHERPIEIGGFTLSDKRASERDKKGGMKSGAVRFTFPRCTLKPGQVAVVFNGCEAKWEQINGPDGKVVGSAYIGDQTTAPAGGHPAF
ncbi:MAG: lamin tail domain-containing protein, partial [Phycisphaerales bacterium]|nr:lamin tail domain-containing protein [Phycisphaerales bacterium]